MPGVTCGWAFSEQHKLGALHPQQDSVHLFHILKHHIHELIKAQQVPCNPAYRTSDPSTATGGFQAWQPSCTGGLAEVSEISVNRISLWSTGYLKTVAYVSQSSLLTGLSSRQWNSSPETLRLLIAGHGCMGVVGSIDQDIDLALWTPHSSSWVHTPDPNQVRHHP